MKLLTNITPDTLLNINFPIKVPKISSMNRLHLWCQSIVPTSNYSTKKSIVYCKWVSYKNGLVNTYRKRTNVGVQRANHRILKIIPSIWMICKVASWFWLQVNNVCVNDEKKNSDSGCFRCRDFGGNFHHLFGISVCTIWRYVSGKSIDTIR